MTRAYHLEKKEDTDLAEKLLRLLLRGPVHNFDFPPRNMYVAVRCLQRLGFPVERTDSGGTPTWQLVEKFA